MTTGQRKAGGTAPVISDEVALVVHAALLAAWMGFLLWSSLAAHLPSIPRLLAWDKLQHFFAYAILTFFAGNFFNSLLKSRRKGWIIGFVYAVGFGLLMEIGQNMLSTSRYADWKDLVANTLGAGLVLSVALLRGEKRP